MASYTHPPTSLRPQNISNRPDPTDTIYIETATMAPPPPAQAVSGQPNPELAGVLRRNQACLNCRRRKLKCDAVRPHCGTCVRSHKHAMRTAPKSNPVMACDYDDEGTAASASTLGSGGSTGSGTGMGQPQMDVEEEGERKRKRKAGSGGGKKKDDDDSTASLMRRIQELEAQIKVQTIRDTVPTYPPAAGVASAPSPTALLDLLSSTAAQASGGNPAGPLRDGAMESIMMSGSTGLTPYMTMDEPQTRYDSRKPSTSSSATSHLESQDTSNQSSAGPSILSPNNIFNFSPCPMGDSMDSGKISDVNATWASANGNVGSSFGLQPSTRTEGPWRGVETADTVFASTGLKYDKDGVSIEQPPMYNSIPIPDGPGEQGGMGNIGADGGAAEFVMDEVLQQKILMDLFWPGWPPNLPEPNIVNDLIESFFTKVPALPRMMNRSKLLTRMSLPPTHSDFPHPSLLHAICACASLWCAPAVYAQSTMAPGTLPKLMSAPASGQKFANFTADPPTSTFSSHQADLAESTIQEGLGSGHKLFDIVRAMIILSRYLLDETKMLKCWIFTGLATRMILPLGLNVRSAEFSLKSVMLPPAVDALEREERIATVWMAFYHDTIGSAASGWGTSLSVDELTIPLPVSAKDFDLELIGMEQNPQDTESLDLWTSHPIIDPYVLCLKAVILLNRVTRFIRKWKNRRIRDDDDLEGMRRPEFRELANAISCFQMSFPASHRSPCRPGPRGKLESDLIAAHLIPHMCTICLYEPFGDITDPTDPATRRLSSATTAIVSIIQEIAAGSGSNADFSTIMHSSASVSLVTAARTSVVLYRQALNIGDLAGAETHRMDIEVVRMALAQFGTRFKIGFHHAQLIEYFLDRATHPTYEKLAAHYPEHPRPGAPELTPNSDIGRCMINALNIKRGYWRLPRAANSNQQPSGISPFGSTPESASGSGSGSGSSNNQQYQNVNQNNPVDSEKWKYFQPQWSEDSSPNAVGNPFITPAHGQGQGPVPVPNSNPIFSGAEGNPYLASVGIGIDGIGIGNGNGISGQGPFPFGPTSAYGANIADSESGQYTFGR